MMTLPRFSRQARRFFCSVGCLITTAIGTEKPNVVFILTDDLGFHQLGCYGSEKIQTPNLDRLAAEGIRFTEAYSGNTVCSPSRVSLFTGRDGRLMENNSNTVQLEEIDVTFAHVLKHAGYDTALFGKYSIGSQMGVTDPLAMGFDTWFGMYSILEGHRQYPQILWRDGQKIRVVENEGGQKGKYAQEAFTEEALAYIQEERENPFLMFVSFSSPHAELDVPEKYLQMYDGKFEESPYLGMSTGEPSDKYAWYYPAVVPQPKATLAGMVTALDDYVGQIVKALEEQGILEDTLIIFTSDNGPHDEGGADPEFFEAAKPHRGMKRDLLEGGIKVPMIAYWPSRIAKGRVDSTPWAFADVLPTLADLAGVNLREVPRVKTNGISILPRLADEAKELPERILYWEFGKQVGDPNSGIIGDISQAARKGTWKAHRKTQESAIELYNLGRDPEERRDLSAENPEILKKFAELFQEAVAR